MRNGLAAHCQCVIERKIRAILPVRYWTAKLEDFRGAVQGHAEDWILNPSDGLFVTGPCGTGKTHLAAAIVRHLAVKGVGVHFKRSADFYREVRESFRPDSEATERGIMSTLERARFLIFDDLGAGSLSDCERRYTLELFDTRLNLLWPTVVTSNWNLQEIAERMDDRIASRLASFTNLQLTGTDRRLIIGKESKG